MLEYILILVIIGFGVLASVTSARDAIKDTINMFITELQNAV